MIFTKQQYLTIYIFEFLMNRNFTNEICLSKLPIFTSIPCSYPYPTRTRQLHTRTQVRVRVPDPRVAVLYPVVPGVIYIPLRVFLKIPDDIFISNQLKVSGNNLWRVRVRVQNRHSRPHPPTPSINICIIYNSSLPSK